MSELKRRLTRAEHDLQATGGDEPITIPIVYCDFEDGEPVAGTESEAGEMIVWPDGRTKTHLNPCSEDER